LGVIVRRIVRWQGRKIGAKREETMTWQMYMTMSNSDLIHGLLAHHDTVCDCLKRGESQSCRIWNLFDDIGRRLTEEAREPFYKTPEGPTN
jgi:hypothetical protein